MAQSRAHLSQFNFFFAVFLVMLALTLRGNNNIAGIQAGQEEHKLFSYADDILLVLSNPETAASEINLAIESE